MKMTQPHPTAQTAAPPAGDSATTAPVVLDHQARRFAEVTREQWRGGIAAWLGWLFDGLDMHLYTLVAAPFVAGLMHAAATDDLVKARTSWIQAAFMVGWALGGGFFGRLGDLVGRSRALALTVLTYATFTGLSFFAQAWWHLLIFRFLAALGVGGEWAVGASLLAETWPRQWRPWIAAVLQTGVNLGVLLACLTTYLLAACHPRYVFLVGVLPAILVFYIRRAVPETKEWQLAKTQSVGRQPGVADLFRGTVRRTTVLTILVCATSLTGWWAFMFWNAQHVRNLHDVATWTDTARGRLVSIAFFLVIGVSIFGNFFAGALARWIGNRRAIVLMFLGMLVAMCGAYGRERGHVSLLLWIPWIGFFSGVFGLFTMYLPPLFPTLLRTTGAGFSYNIGRIFAGAGTIVFGLFSHVGDFRRALLLDGLLFLPALIFAMLLPDQEYSAPQPNPSATDRSAKL